MNEIILNLQIGFLPITLGKFVLLLSLSSSFPMPPSDVYPFLSFATLDVVLELCDLPTSLACLHRFLDFLLMLLVFVWCYVFNLIHWSEEWPVFLFIRYFRVLYLNHWSATRSVWLSPLLRRSSKFCYLNHWSAKRSVCYGSSTLKIHIWTIGIKFTSEINVICLTIDILRFLLRL